MPKITAGSNATVSVPAGSVVSVDGGLIRFEFPSGTILFEGDASGQTFGPYSTTNSAVITSLIGGVDYAVTTPPYAVVPFTPNNAVIAGGSIAGRNIWAQTLQQALAARPNGISLRASTLGNSIFAGVNGISISDQALWQCGSSLMWLRNGGIAGNTSAQMLARVSTDVPSNAQVCFIMEGSNDSTANTVLDHRTNMEAIIVALLARSILPVFVAAPPYTGRAAIMHGFLAAEHALARKYGISILDPWDGLVDRTTGDWTSGNTSDNVHPTLAAGHVARAALVSLIQGSTSTVWAPRTNVSGTAGYCLGGGNCLMLTDANSDGVPDGWTKAGTATASVATAPTGFRGNFARLTGSAGGGNPFLRKIITTGWNAGDELLICMGMEVGGSGTNGQTFVQIICDGGTVNTNYVNGTLEDIAAQRLCISLTPTTTSQIEVYTKINGSGTGNYIGVGEFEVYNLTALLNR